MRVIPITGEPTRFWVESSSLSCPVCGSTVSRLRQSNLRLEPGDICRRCVRLNTPVGKVGRYAVGRYALRWHLVDVAPFWPLGQCGCEHWVFTLRKEIEAVPPFRLATLTQREADRLRCAHVEAARTCALNAAIRGHEAARTGGRREEDAA